MSDENDEELPEWIDDGAWYTSVAEVRSGGFETDLSDEEIAEHIDDANIDVTEKVEGHYDDRRLRKMERDAARHSIKYTVEAERMVESEQTGSIRRDYMGAFESEEDLLETPYGKKVLRKDVDDILLQGEFWSVQA